MGSSFAAPLPEPTPALIEEALGEAFPAWEQLVGQLGADGVELGWRYYRDGGWLAKATHGRTTTAWIQVDEGFTRITFYFPERHRDALSETAGLSPRARQAIIDGKPIGKSLPLTLEIRASENLADVAIATQYKLTAR